MSRANDEANETGPDEPEPRVRARFREAGIILGFMCALLVAIALVVGELETSDRYHIDLAECLPPIPDDLTGADLIRRSLAAENLSRHRISIFDSNLDLLVRQTLESNPWIRRVNSVERDFPNRVKLDVEFRRAFAAIERGGDYLLADETGELLPVSGPEPLVAPPILTLRRHGVEPFEPRGFDESWFVEAVRQGVAVIRDLETVSDSYAFETLPIIEVDVSNHGHRLSRRNPEIVLVTARFVNPPVAGTRHPVVVNWGRSREHPRARIELPIERKVGHLEDLVRTLPRLHRVHVIDVRFPEAHFRQNDSTGS